MPKIPRKFLWPAVGGLALIAFLSREPRLWFVAMLAVVGAVFLDQPSGTQYALNKKVWAAAAGLLLAALVMRIPLFIFAGSLALPVVALLEWREATRWRRHQSWLQQAPSPPHAPVSSDTPLDQLPPPTPYQPVPSPPPYQPRSTSSYIGTVVAVVAVVGGLVILAGAVLLIAVASSMKSSNK
jgi:hypothetical protein